MQHWLVVPYWCSRTAYWSHFQGSSSPWRMIRPGQNTVFIGYGVDTDWISQKANELILRGKCKNLLFPIHNRSANKHFIYVCNNTISSNNLKITTVIPKYYFTCLTHIIFISQVKQGTDVQYSMFLSFNRTLWVTEFHENQTNLSCKTGTVLLVMLMQ